jgi:manganese/zinc/iron transport system permease protein
MGWLFDLFACDHTLRVVVFGSALLGLVSGALGTFAVLRRQSLLGDAVSHAALPGIVLAYMITRSKAPSVLLTGAAIAGWLGALTVLGIVRTSRVKFDAALGMVLSVYFGVGYMLLTFLQRQPDAGQAGLDKFLFGQAATLVERDVVLLGGLGAVALLVVAAFWKELKLLAFDAEFGTSLGWPMLYLDVLLTGILVLAIVVGLQTVGVVLMSAMLVAPAVAARQWTNHLGRLVALAGLFGALAGLAGGILSSLADRVPTGPTIVLCISAILVVSLGIGPARGLLWRELRHYRNRRRLRLEAVLDDLLELSRHHDDIGYGHSLAVLERMAGGHRGVAASLRALLDRGWVRRVGRDAWALTPEGRDQAMRQRTERNHDDVA